MGSTIYPPVLLNIGTGQTPSSATVTSSSTEILASNSSRSSAFLGNIGKNDVWLACDVTAVLNEGVLLSRNGGSMLIDGTALTLGAVNGICAATKTSTVTFQELNI